MIQRKNVLIIDDDENILRTFARILQRNGYTTDTAVTGKEAIQKAQEKLYDAALIDVCLPDMNGTDLLRKLPNQNSNKMIKIIITGFPTMAPKTGSDAYLVKPVKPDDLMSILKNKLSQN